MIMMLLRMKLIKIITNKIGKNGKILEDNWRGHRHYEFQKIFPFWQRKYSLTRSWRRTCAGVPTPNSGSPVSFSRLIFAFAVGAAGWLELRKPEGSVARFLGCLLRRGVADRSSENSLVTTTNTCLPQSCTVSRRRILKHSATVSLTSSVSIFPSAAHPSLVTFRLFCLFFRPCSNSSSFQAVSLSSLVVLRPTCWSSVY